MADALGQGQARLRCLEVMDNGDVTLQWRSELIGTGAYAYVLFHSPDYAGPYQKLDSLLDMTLGAYLHAGAGALSAPQHYYMLIYRNTGISAPSDTLTTMLLNLATADNETADLSWNPLHVPLMPYMHPWYLLYREFPPGNRVLIDSTQSLSIAHHFWECNQASDTVRFQVGVRVREFSYECYSLSSKTGNVLKNQSNRFPPAIDSVSISPDGRAVIGWQPGQEQDIMGYTIFRVTSTNDSIDYVDGRFNTSYTHTTSNPCNGPIRYIIHSVDSCGNKSPFPYDPVTFLDLPHSTLYLADIQYDPCLMTNLLTWNEYENFNPPLGYTQILVSQDGGAYQPLVTVYPGQAAYTHTGLLPNTTYSYFVRAFSQDGQKSSTSCRKQVTTYNSPSPAYMYTRYVTVEDNSAVNLLFYTDISANVQSYNILRSDSPSGPFQTVGSIPDQGEELVSFLDVSADVSAASYYYQVEVIDSCGVPLRIANMARTIWLQVEALDNLENNLAWNAYESWDGGVAGYRIYRRLNNDPSLELVQSVGPATLEYTDNVAGFTGSVSRITYLVEAFEGDTNAWGFQETSRSNEALAEQESVIYLPNAILPRSAANNLLKPISVFVGQEGYTLRVYNRWGQLLFQTSDPGQGWDGTYNGQWVEGGVYVYLVTYRNAMNQQKVQKGNVAVIY